MDKTDLKTDLVNIKSRSIQVSHKVSFNSKITTINIFAQCKRHYKVIYLNKYQYLIQYLRQPLFGKSKLSLCYKVVDCKKKTIQELDPVNPVSLRFNDAIRLSDKSFVIVNGCSKLTKFQINKEQKYEKISQEQKGINRLIFLHQSQQIIQFDSSGIRYFKTQQYIIKFQKDGQKNSQWYYGTTDQKQQIIYDIGQNWIKILNIKTKKIMKINVPSQLDIIKGVWNHFKRLNIYLDEDFIIMAPNQTKNQLFIIYKHDYVNNTTICLKEQPSNQGIFVTIHKPDSIIVYLNIFKSKYQLKFYNYKAMQTVKDIQLDSYSFAANFNCDYYYSPLSQKMSSNLKQIAFLSNNVNKNNLTLKIFEQIELNKLYFHLIKKSSLWINYGQKIAIKIFKILQQSNNSLNVFLK